MADPQDNLKESGLQSIVKIVSGLLSPLTDATKKGLRKEYFDSLGIDDSTFENKSTDKVDSFLAKKAEDADVLAFAEALKQTTDLVTSVKDVIERNVQAIGGQPFEKNRLINDLTTSLLNILTMDYFRLRLPMLHNIFMMFYSLNNFSNRGSGAVNVADMVGNYLKRWAKSFDLENADEARKLAEVFFVVGTIMAYIANSKLSAEAAKDDINTQLLVGGQFGSETNRKTELTTARDFINDLLGRTFEMAIGYEKGTQKNEMSATLVMLSKEDGSSGVDVLVKDGFSQKSIPLSDNWFFSFDVTGSMHFRTGGNNTDSDVDLTSSKMALAFERLIFEKNIKPEDIDIPTFFTYFKFGFGNLSMQLDASPKDLALTFVTQVIYAITNKKIVNGKEEKGGFPFSHLPEMRNIANIPLRYSLKNGFGFDGGFIGERPPAAPATPAPAPPPSPAARAAAPPAPGANNAAPAPAPTSTPTTQTGTFSIPIHKELSIVRFDKVNLDLDTDKGFGVAITLDFAIKLGPVVISISKMGTSLSARKRTTEPLNGGVLGYDVVPGFVPPSGAGIVVDAKAVKGGGFLYFDDKNGTYFGAIELDIKGIFALKAIGIIRTRDDAGKDLFSFLILITAEFKPIQLGFGFTLNGVGGMLGLNRGVNVPFLQEGLTSGVLENILFPKDVVANMNRIISDLTKAFPISENHFVVGLMAKIGWGTPPKITADIGIIMQLPDPVILLPGVLRANFPSEKNAILKLKAAFLGVLDFKNQLIFFRADLIESRILSFKLTGTWVIGISWGSTSVFVLSAGGFNPRFKEIPKLPGLPNAFTNMQRIGIQLLDTDNPKISVETYFAITSNTVQVGGKAEFYYDIAFGYNIYGRLEVHALFQFSPFHFVFDIAAEIALRDGTDWVMGIGVYGMLEGPTPWHIKASAVVKTPWYLPDIEVELEKTWGSTVPALPVATAQVAQLVKAAIADASNWNAILPSGTFAHVTFRQPEPPADATKPPVVRLAPNSILRFSQSVVPLDMSLEKFGEQQPDVNRFSIQSVKIGTIELKGNDLRDLFSADMFVKLSTDEKLSRPSFEKMKSGFEVQDSTNALKIGAAQTIAVTGEISDTSASKFTPQQPRIPMKDQMGRLVRTSSAMYKSAASADNKMKKGGYAYMQPAAKDQYVVATKDTMTNHLVNQTFSSYSEASEALRKQPIAVRGRLQVIENYEL